jgi:hypothetical protein
MGGGGSGGHAAVGVLNGVVWMGGGGSQSEG